MTIEKRLVRPKSGRGYSQFEIILVVILLMVFIGIALRMLVNFAADAERMEMQGVLENIQTSVMTVMSEHLIDDGLEQLASLDGANPMHLLKQVPPNYAGEIGNNDPRPDAGYWYFNKDQQVLVYMVRNQSFLATPGNNTGDTEIEDNGAAIFKLRFNYTDNNYNQKFDAEVDTAQGLELSPINDYLWTN